MANHSDERNYPKHIALVPLLFLSVGAMVLVSDTASAQRTNTIPDTPTAAPASPTNDKTSALGQALAACNQDAEKEPFTLPGLKGEITLDRCYKGRAHLICVFKALSTEATSLTGTYSKIVDAKYPDLTTVERFTSTQFSMKARQPCAIIAFNDARSCISGGCRRLPDQSANPCGRYHWIRRLRAKKFKELKSQYEAATKCVGNVEQAFKDVSLAGLTKAPEVLQSITASIDGDVAKTSKVYEQISNLAEKIEQSNKAMKMVTKLHHAICMNEKAVEQSGREHR